MAFQKNIEEYHDLWEDKRYFLAPILPTSDTTQLWGDVKYIPYRKHSISFTKILLPPELAPEIVRRMIESKCEVLENQPDYVEYGRIERLWTDRRGEFVIVKDIHPTRPYQIYHPAYQEWLSLKIDSERYDLIIKNMLEAGVSVWDHS